MLREGGFRAPAPLRVVLTPDQVSRAHTTSRKIEAYRRYGKAKDMWKRGVHPDAGFIGRLGEQAVVTLGAKYGFPAETNDSLLARGDKGKDFEIWGTSVQVKTQCGRWDPFLIRRRDCRHRILPLVADVFVFCRTAGPPDVFILGWCLKRTVMQGGKAAPSPKRGAQWRNLELPLSHLETPQSMGQHLDNERRLTEC